MVDAGSSGTRAHVFQWNPKSSPPNIIPYPNRSYGAVIKSHIPLSSAANDTKAIRKIFEPVIIEATRVIPPDFYSSTKFYVFATAGLRLLPVSDQAIILELTTQYLSERSPFVIKSKNIRIMSGCEEALYGWISVNHLKMSRKAELGSLDMGGASLQVAFKVKKKFSKNVHSIRIGKKKFYVYGFSFLGYGVNEAMKRIISIKPDANPCFPVGYKGGTGSFLECKNLILSHVNELSFQTNLTQRIKTFYGMASFFYANQFLKLPLNSSIKQMSEAGKSYCQQNWSELKDKYPKNSFLQNYCFFESFQVAFLTHGFGFDFNRSEILKAGDIEGADLSWAIGAMMKEAKLAQIDPPLIPSILPLVLANIPLIYFLTFRYFNPKHRQKHSILIEDAYKML